MGTPMEPGRLRWVFGALCVVGVLGVSSGAQDRVAERVLAAQLTRIGVDAGLCAAPYGAVLRPGGLPVVVEETTPGRAVSPAAARVVATDRAFTVGAGDGARARLRVTELRDGLRILGRWSLRRVSAVSQETWDLRNTEGLGAMAVPQVPLLMYLLGAGWMCGMTPARRARIACLIGLLTQALYWLATAVYLAFGQVPATPFSSASGLGVYVWMLGVSGRLSPALAAGILAVPRAIHAGLLGGKAMDYCDRSIEPLTRIFLTDA